MITNDCKLRVVETGRDRLQKILCVFIWIISVSSIGYAQDSLILQHRTKVNKQKALSLDRYMAFKTRDTLYAFNKILSFSDSTITIDTYKNPTVISCTDLQYIKKDWFRDRSWLEPFAWFGICAIMAVPLLPVAAIEDGEAGVNQWFKGEGILCAITVPPLILGTRTTKYDLQKKWQIEIK